MIQVPNLRLGTVVLNVTNLDLQIQFYQQVIGLTLIDRNQRMAQLGIAGQSQPLIQMEVTDQTGTDAFGLYHVAILLPDRPSLGAALQHLLTNRVPLQGGSDHGYSEAIYLEDTEGNGIELYRDKPVESWDIREDGRIVADSAAMDTDSLLSQAKPLSSPYLLPVGTKVGHVHLSVPHARTSAQRFETAFGMENKFTFSTASFIASGTYHHHLAFNQWSSTGKVKRQAGQPGLQHFTIIYQNPQDFLVAKTKAQIEGFHLVEGAETSYLLEDPDGIRVKVSLED